MYEAVKRQNSTLNKHFAISNYRELHLKEKD